MYDKSERIVCPICGGKYQILSSHVSRSHGMTTDELLEKYPGTKIMTDYQRNRIEGDLAKGRKKNWSNPEYKEKMISAAKRNMKVLHDDPELREKALRNSVIANQIRRDSMDPDEYFKERSEAAKKGWQLESRQQAHSSMLKELWRDPEYRAKHTERFRQQMLELWSDPEAVAETQMGLDPSRFLSKYTRPSGEEVIMRSSWEVMVAGILDDNGIDYEYEGLSIPYEYEGRRRSYIVDFVLGDTILEVKPREFTRSEVVQVKKQAVIDSGYKFKFVTENELSLPEREFINYILE